MNKTVRLFINHRIHMTQENYDSLIFQYPGLSSFIKSCQKENRHRDVLDFLFNIETEEPNIKSEN